MDDFGNIPGWPTRQQEKIYSTISTFENLSNVPLEIDGRLILPGEKLWVCRWCSASNAIGLHNCQECAMPRPEGVR